MKSKKIIALGLALVLGLGLAACGGKEVASGEETPSELPAVSQEPTDSATPTHVGTPTPEDTQQTDAPGSDTPVPASPTAATTGEPPQSAAPTAAAPSASAPTAAATATTEPTPESKKEPTAKEVYDAVEKAAGNSGYYDASSLVENFYNLSAGDLEDYRFAMPSMSSKLEETFVAKVKSGKLSAVKSACESRQQGLVEEAAEYPATGDYVGSYQLVTEGDWILFYVGPNASKAADAFKNGVK